MHFAVVEPGVDLDVDPDGNVACPIQPGRSMPTSGPERKHRAFCRRSGLGYLVYDWMSSTSEAGQP